MGLSHFENEGSCAWGSSEYRWQLCGKRCQFATIHEPARIFQSGEGDAVLTGCEGRLVSKGRGHTRVWKAQNSLARPSGQGNFVLLDRCDRRVCWTTKPVDERKNLQGVPVPSRGLADVGSKRKRSF